MKALIDTIEKWLKKIILLQILFLLIAQILLQIDTAAPYLNKAIRLEGVIHSLDSDPLPVSETIDHNR